MSRQGTGLTALIVPCHNYGRFLAEMLQSISSQTVLPAEVVLIDDGSTDESPEAIAALQNHYGQVLPLRVLTQPNRGFARTVARGLAETKSPYVAVVSADDRLHPRFVEALEGALNARPEAGFAYPKMVLFGDEDGVYRTYPWDVDRLVFDHNYIPGIALMRRSAYLRTRGLRELRAYEDWDLWLSFAERRFAGVLVPEILYEWRRHASARNHNSLRIRVWLRVQILLSHRRLIARRWKSVVPWTGYAVARRIAYRLGLSTGRQRRSRSCWVEAP